MSDTDWCFWCPNKGCESCRYKGSDDPNKRAKTTVIWENRTGNDERPAASTADRSSRSDSPERKEGVAQ